MTERYEELAPRPVEPTMELAPEPEAKTAVQLAMPTKELALRLLDKVGFAQRLVGYKIIMLTKAKEASICSLAEAIDFTDLCCQSYNKDKVLREGGRRFIARLDLNSLRDWIGLALGDKDLAEAITEELGEGCSSRRVDEMTKYFLKHAGPIKELMQQRLKQCEEIVGVEPEA